MIRVRRFTLASCVALTLCLGLGIVGVAGQRTGLVQLPQGIGSPPQNADTGSGTDTESSTGSTGQSAPQVPNVDDQADRVREAHKLLSARAAAIRDTSKRAWMATVDLGSPAFRARQSVAFDNLITLPLGHFVYTAARPARALSAARALQVGPKAWAASVTGTYAIAGFDRSPQLFDATYTMVQRPGGWRIADDTDGVTPMQIWDLPGMTALPGRSCLVVGNAPRPRMEESRSMSEVAVRRLSGIWGTGWNSRVVIVTPSTGTQFAGLLRSSGKGLDQVAATTQGVSQPGRRALGDRVVINPQVFTALRPIGRRVVITHELTHVAARSSTTRPVPIWLAEGMADYVGYSGLSIERERVASDLLALVRAGKGPSELPTAADFDPSRTRIATSYSSSWLAVSRLVDLYGQARVVAFYRAAASAPTSGVRRDPEVTAAAEFLKSFGVTQAVFVAGWKRYLRTLAQARA